MLETQRLLLLPLTYKQLVKYIKNDGSLECELNLSLSPRVISPELKEALEQTILPHVADINRDYLFSTLWTAILKEQNKMVGDLCFFGEPNDNGEIEIGYGTYEEHRNKGYMTEAVGGMIKWAQEQHNVIYVNASTEKENIASYSILEKNNFVKVGESGTLLNWQLKIR